MGCSEEIFGSSALFTNSMTPNRCREWQEELEARVSSRIDDLVKQFTDQLREVKDALIDDIRRQEGSSAVLTASSQEKATTVVEPRAPIRSASEKKDTNTETDAVRDMFDDGLVPASASQRTASELREKSGMKATSEGSKVAATHGATLESTKRLEVGRPDKQLCSPLRRASRDRDDASHSDFDDLIHELSQPVVDSASSTKFVTPSEQALEPTAEDDDSDSCSSDVVDEILAELHKPRPNTENVQAEVAHGSLSKTDQKAAGAKHSQPGDNQDSLEGVVHKVEARRKQIAESQSQCDTKTEKIGSTPGQGVEIRHKQTQKGQSRCDASAKKIGSSSGQELESRPKQVDKVQCPATAHAESIGLTSGQELKARQKQIGEDQCQEKIGSTLGQELESRPKHVDKPQSQSVANAKKIGSTSGQVMQVTEELETRLLSPEESRWEWYKASLNIASSSSTAAVEESEQVDQMTTTVTVESEQSLLTVASANSGNKRRKKEWWNQMYGNRDAVTQHPNGIGGQQQQSLRVHKSVGSFSKGASAREGARSHIANVEEFSPFPCARPLAPRLPSAPNGFCKDLPLVDDVLPPMPDEATRGRSRSTSREAAVGARGRQFFHH
jgi:hypothetical protein